MFYCIKEEIDYNTFPNVYIILPYSIDNNNIINHLEDNKYILKYDKRVLTNKDHYFDMIRIPRNSSKYVMDTLCTYNFELTTIIME